MCDIVFSSFHLGPENLIVKTGQFDALTIALPCPLLVSVER